MTHKPELLRRLLRFGLVGLTVMVFFMGANWVLGRWMSPVLAFLVAYLPAIALHFTLSKHWTFGCERTDTARQVSQYLFSVGVTFLVQLAFFAVARQWLELPGWLAAGFANAGQMVVSFGLLQWHVFAPRKDAS